MVTVEAGTALGWGYESDEEERSTAIHEAGHAVCSYLFRSTPRPCASRSASAGTRAATSSRSRRSSGSPLTATS
jgi:hypothetical protein